LGIEIGDWGEKTTREYAYIWLMWKLANDK